MIAYMIPKILQETKTMVLWVFGYGSLVWNPGFDFDAKIIGFIKDYRRVFDLGMKAFYVSIFFFPKFLAKCWILEQILIHLLFQHA